MTLRELRAALPHPYRVKVFGFVNIEGEKTSFYEITDSLYYSKFEKVLECEVFSLQAPEADCFEIAIK